MWSGIEVGEHNVSNVGRAVAELFRSGGPRFRPARMPAAGHDGIDLPGRESRQSWIPKPVTTNNQSSVSTSRAMASQAMPNTFMVPQLRWWTFTSGPRFQGGDT